MMDSGKELTYKRVGSDLEIDIPSELPDPNSSVVIVDIKGRPEVYDFPLIVPLMGKFVGSGEFSFQNVPEGVDIRYTDDGSDPAAGSELFVGEVKIAKETVVKAAYFSKGKRISGIISRKFTDVAATPSLDVSVSGSGLVCKYYKGSWNYLPKFTSEKVVEEFIAPVPKLVGEEGEEDFGATFDGYINIPQDGMFTFSLSSDDGSVMFLDGNRIITNNGLHAPVEIDYTAPLAKGYHKIKIDYFQKTGGSELSFKVKGPGIDTNTDLKSLLFH